MNTIKSMIQKLQETAPEFLEELHEGIKTNEANIFPGFSEPVEAELKEMDESKVKHLRFTLGCLFRGMAGAKPEYIKEVLNLALLEIPAITKSYKARGARNTHLAEIYDVASQLSDESLAEMAKEAKEIIAA